MFWVVGEFPQVSSTKGNSVYFDSRHKPVRSIFCVFIMKHPYQRRAFW